MGFSASGWMRASARAYPEQIAEFLEEPAAFAVVAPAVVDRAHLRRLGADEERLVEAPLAAGAGELAGVAVDFGERDAGRHLEVLVGPARHGGLHELGPDG